MKAPTIRKLTHVLPLPGHYILRLLDLIDCFIKYPDSPIVVKARGSCAAFEIRNCREFIQRNIYFLGYYEFRETQLVKSILRPGDLFIDVGANIGWYTLLAAYTVGPSGQVIAFEPSTSIFNYLKLNVDLNSANNVILEKFAISDKIGTAILSGISDKNIGLGNIIKHSKLASDSAEEVYTISLDDYCRDRNINKIRSIKIDVEGSEMMVLKGMMNILENNQCDYIMVEIDDVRLRGIGSSCSELLNLLRSYKYQLFHINLLGLVPLKSNEKISFANILARAALS